MSAEWDPEALICPSCSGPKSRQAQQCAECSGYACNTPEQRDKHALCGAKKRNGEKCRAWAGMGTDHPGIGPCRFHAGNTTNHRKHAVALQAKQRMIQLGTPIEDVTAPEALIGLLRSSAGTVKWVRDEIAELDDLGTNEAAVLLRLYDDERAMLLRVSEAAVRAGIAEHLIKLETARAMTTLQVIRDAARDAGLNATQLQALGVSLRKRLAEATGDPGADEADARLAELRQRIADDDERRVAAIAERRAQELSGLTFPPAEYVKEPA